MKGDILMDNSISQQNLSDALTLFKTNLDNKYNNNSKITELENALADLNLRSTIGAELDYGYFTMSADQTTDIATNLPVKINTIGSAKNVELKATDYTFKLLKGKKYNIYCMIRVSGNSATPFLQFFNNTLNSYIGEVLYAPVVSSGSGANTGNSFKIFCDCTKYTQDVSISLNFKGSGGSFPSTVFAEATSIFVEELGRTVILDPLDTQGNHTFEYATFNSLVDTIQSVSANENIFKYLHKADGNMTINTDYTIPLKKNKTYKIHCEISISTTDGVITTLLDNNNIVYDKSYTGATNGWSDCSIDTTITPSSDINIKLFNDKTKNIYLLSTKVTIQEIIQPTITEYSHYNEVSNPLTTIPLQYGKFHNSKDMTIGVTTPLLFDTLDEGNMSISNGGIHLTGGKSYLIIPNLWNFSSVYGLFLYDMIKKADIMRLNVGGNSVTGGMIYNPSVDVDISFRTEGNITIYGVWNSVTILEYRNNPVNQYGGFESKVLFEGNSGNALNVKQSLSDNISNFDFLCIVVKWWTDSLESHFFVETKSLIDKIIASPTGRHLFLAPYSNSYIILNFSTNYLSFQIVERLLANSNLSPNGITKITGIKGQLPTLMQGGVF
jgi:hypothetical protein